MNLPIRQRAGHEPRTHFDTTELRLTGINSPSFAELNRTYQYDKALNTIAANDEIEDLKFVVNGNNQITRVISQYQTRENYYYDQNGYISQQYIHTEDYRYNDGDSRSHIAIDNHDLYQQGNKLNRIGNQHYRYDNAGRLIEKTDIQDGFRQKTTYYRWNGNNQLESLTNARGETWYYKYDALGRRTEKACPQQNITTRYLWDGDQVAYQETERHGKTESKRHSIFNGWELIAQQDGYQKQDLRRNRKQWTQTTGYAVCQPNGQPLALFNPQGKRTWRKAPNSLWGLPLLSSWERKQAEPLNPNLLFAGQYVDDESGLAYNRFRYYDPQSGNYLASDPIGLNGGETPYAYVHNPMGWVDPFGLAGCSTTLGRNMMESMGLPRSTTWAGHQAHHIIPVQLMNHPALEKIGYNIDEAANGIFLRTLDDKVSAMSRHQGNHHGYTDAVRDALDKINLNNSPDDIAKEVSRIQEAARRGLQNGTPIRSKDMFNSTIFGKDINGIGRAKVYDLWSKIL